MGKSRDRHHAGAAAMILGNGLTSIWDPSLRRRDRRLAGAYGLQTALELVRKAHHLERPQEGFAAGPDAGVGDRLGRRQKGRGRPALS